jgi:hypothetical protein
MASQTGEWTIGKSSILSKVKKKKYQLRQNEGESSAAHDCPEGYVVLTTPNKYGAYCEQIPVCGKDYIGTPPNCEYCPNGKDKNGICFF